MVAISQEMDPIHATSFLVEGASIKDPNALGSADGEETPSAFPLQHEPFVGEQEDESACLASEVLLEPSSRDAVESALQERLAAVRTPASKSAQEMDEHHIPDSTVATLNQSLVDSLQQEYSDQDITTYKSLEFRLKAEGMSTTSSSPREHSSDPSQPSDPSSNEDRLSNGEEPDAPPRVVIAKTPSRSVSPSSRSKHGGLRRGKWTVEEEAYVARVIQDFNSGYLDAPAGTTLRTYLSEKLQCDPMRITKKFTGDACIGKRVFHPAVRSPSNAACIDKAQAELDSLEKRWRRRLEMQQRESAKKAHATSLNPPSRSASVVESSDDVVTNGVQGSKQNVVAKTASWLDRAKAVLKGPELSSPSSGGTNDLQSQLQEVQLLIHEGPVIQHASAGLASILDQEQGEALDGASPGSEPADKRMRTAEDAEALVGFIRSVRASAASGQDA